MSGDGRPLILTLMIRPTAVKNYRDRFTETVLIKNSFSKESPLLTIGPLGYEVDLRACPMSNKNNKSAFDDN